MRVTLENVQDLLDVVSDYCSEQGACKYCIFYGVGNLCETIREYPVLEYILDDEGYVHE